MNAPILLAKFVAAANNFPVKFSSPNNGFDPLALHKFQYVSYQTFHSITPGCIHRLQKETNV